MLAALTMHERRHKQNDAQCNRIRMRHELLRVGVPYTVAAYVQSWRTGLYMVFLFAHRDGTVVNKMVSSFILRISSFVWFRLVSSTTPHPEVYFVNFGSRFQIRKVSHRSLKVSEEKLMTPSCATSR